MEGQQATSNPHTSRKLFDGGQARATLWRPHLTWWLLVSLMALNICIKAIDDPELFGVPEQIVVFPSQPFSVKSLLLCSILCHQRKCTQFSLQDGSCNLGGLNSSSVYPPMMLYKKLEYTGPFSYAEMPRNLQTKSSSEISSKFSSSKAVDPKLSTWFCSVIGLADQWWRVDLGSVFLVGFIDLFPRNAEGDAHFFNNVEIRVGWTDIDDGDFTSWTLFANYVGPYGPNDGRLNFTVEEGVFGRYISVKRSTSDGALKILDAKIFVRRN